MKRLFFILMAVVCYQAALCDCFSWCRDIAGGSHVYYSDSIYRNIYTWLAYEIPTGSKIDSALIIELGMRKFERVKKTEFLFRTWNDSIYVQYNRDSSLFECGEARAYQSKTIYLRDDFGHVAAHCNFGTVFIQPTINSKVQLITISQPYIYSGVKNYAQTHHLQRCKKLSDGVDYFVLRSTGGIRSTTDRLPTRWITTAKENTESFGQLTRTWEVNSKDTLLQNGRLTAVNTNYVVRVYNNDDDERTFETITVQKKDMPELRVSEIIAHNSHFYDWTCYPFAFLDGYQVVFTIKSKPVEKVNLMNKEVWELVYKLLCTFQCNAQVKGKQSDRYYVYDGYNNNFINKGYTEVTDIQDIRKGRGEEKIMSQSKTPDLKIP